MQNDQQKVTLTYVNKQLS